MYLRQFVDPEVFHEQRGFGIAGSIISDNVNMNYRFEKPTNWCSAARPGPGVGFAIGRKGHWAILTNVEATSGHLSLIHASPSLLDSKDDILAVDWLNYNTVVGGARSGKVLLGDVRTHTGDFSLRIKADEGIQHVRTLDSNKIVVGSLNNKVWIQPRRN